MASTYTTNLGIEKIATGEQSGTWGSTTNTNLDLIDQAVNGIVQITVAATGSTGSPNALTISNGSASDGRNKFIDFYSPTDLGGTVYYQLDPNDAEKVAFVRNSLGGGQTLVLFQGTYNASNDVEVPNGVDMLVKFDGTGASATVTNVFEKLQVNALSVNDGNITNVGDIALDSISADGTDINVSVSDNSATALTVKEGANTYLTIDTTNSAEKVLVSKTLDIGDNNITNVGNIALDSISADGTQIDIDITDNTASAFTISEGANNYIEITTTDGSELITVSKNSTFAGTTIADLGVVTTVDINGGTIDGTTIGGASAGAGTFTTVTTTGGSTFASTVEITNGGLNLSPAGTANAIVNAGASMFINIDSDNNNAGESFYISRDATNTTGARVAKFDAIGDISFYEDMGVTPKMVWKAADERLGIGTASPVRTLHVDGASNLVGRFSSSATEGFIQLAGSGTSTAPRVGATGNNFLVYTNDAERLRIDSGGDVSFRDTSANQAFYWDASAASLGIGTSSPRTKFDVLLSGTANTGGSLAPSLALFTGPGLEPLTDGSRAGANVNIESNTAQGANVGASLMFGGRYVDSSTVSTGFGAIYGAKENGTSNNLSGYLAFYTNRSGTTTKAMTIDSSGNLGLGVTPSAWSSNFKALQSGNGSAFVGFAGNDQTFVISNAYNDGSWKYKNSAGAGYYEIQGVGNGVHAWYNAPSGTAGAAITFTQAMTLDASGNLLVGTTSAVASERFNVTGSVATGFVTRVINSNATNPQGMLLYYSGASPNSSAAPFLYCLDTTALKAEIRSNGGLANYQSNNVDLSDERTKTDINAAPSYWDKIGALEIVTYKYKDQTHNDVNVGVIAQQVETVEPVWVDADGFGDTPEGEEPLKTVYTKDITFAAIKALQEAMTRIETLEAEVAALKGA